MRVCTSSISLPRISTELYCEPAHFLQELIQNKDDCSYNAAVAPEMIFTSSLGKLCIDSNELGFSWANIRLLCGIGQTSKKGGDSLARKASASSPFLRLRMWSVSSLVFIRSSSTRPPLSGWYFPSGPTSPSYACLELHPCFLRCRWGTMAPR